MTVIFLNKIDLLENTHKKYNNYININMRYIEKYTYTFTVHLDISNKSITNKREKETSNFSYLEDNKSCKM